MSSNCCLLLGHRSPGRTQIYQASKTRLLLTKHSTRVLQNRGGGGGGGGDDNSGSVPLVALALATEALRGHTPFYSCSYNVLLNLHLTFAVKEHGFLFFFTVIGRLKHVGVVSKENLESRRPTWFKVQALARTKRHFTPAREPRPAKPPTWLLLSESMADDVIQGFFFAHYTYMFLNQPITAKRKIRIQLLLSA